MTMNNRIYDTVVVGSGPGGLTAAIYNIRANLKTVVIAGDHPGGQLTITTVVENYPGFADGIGGTKLMMDMMQQLKNLGGEIINERVVSIKIEKGGIVMPFVQGFTVELGSGKKIETKAVIVATGARARWLDIGEKELIGKGVSGCATCDGMFFRDKTVAVVGGGDVACTEANFLTKFAKKVILIHRRDQLRASSAEQKKVLNNHKIEMWWNMEVIGVNPKIQITSSPNNNQIPITNNQTKLQNIRVKNNKTGEEKTVEMDGLFVAIGHDPATEMVASLVKRKESGHIMVMGGGQYHTMTTTPGIFACGDCVDDRYRQAIIAAGMGAMAGLDAEKWIENGK